VYFCLKLVSDNFATAHRSSPCHRPFSLRLCSLPIFCCSFSGCHFFCSLNYRCRSLRKITLCCPFFLGPYPLIFRCRILPLPNYPVAQSPVAVFSVALFFSCLFYRCRFCRESSYRIASHRTLRSVKRTLKLRGLSNPAVRGGY